MRILPQKKWKKALVVTLLIFLVVGVPVIAFLEYSVYNEVVTPVEVKNADGDKTALVIYHPGLTAFSRDVAETLTDRLASNGWRVETTTASSQTPTNITKYELIVLDWPIYDFNPGPTLTNYIHRIGDLRGKDAVIVSIGGGINPFNAQDTMKKIVQDANGNIKDSITIFRGGDFTEKVDQFASKILP